MTIWSQSPEDYFIIEHLINYLRRKKKSTTIIYQNKTFDKKYDKQLNCNSHKIFSSKINFLNKIYFIYYLIYLIFYIFFKKPHILIIFNNYPLLIIQIIKYFYKGKLIYHNFDYEPFEKNIFKKLLNHFEKKNINLFNEVIFSNEKRGIKFNKYLKKKINIKTVNNCLPLNYLPKIKYKKKKIVSIFRIGTIGPGHGLINLIKSFKYLPVNYHLTLCGIVLNKNFYSDLKSIIRSSNIERRVKINVSASKKQWIKKMIDSDVGVAFYEPVNTSHKFMTGASQKINSYLAAGLPVLLSNEQQFKLFTKKYKCSVNVNITKPKDIAYKIKSTLSNKEKIKKLKNNSLAAFKNNFNFDNQIKKISLFYD